MTPKEKWEKITNPKCLSDYGLSISEEELATFPEGQAILAEIKSNREELERMSKLVRELGFSMAKVIDEEITNVLHKKTN